MSLESTQAAEGRDLGKKEEGEKGEELSPLAAGCFRLAQLYHLTGL